MSDGNVEKLTFSLNGETVEAGKGELVIDAAERAGVHIPRFCYHPRMRPVGMCRMCIVDIDTGRGATLQPSCMIPVSQDMVVDTESEATKKAQDGVLEFLLINHPLDCPVCDKGGECPLQDNAYAYGPGESRFVEEKRHFAKPIPVSDLVLLDRERCILCDRCTRFAKEVAGDPLIHFLERGGQTEVNTFPDHPFASYFSGNTVQICPVGALTAGPYRFKARPWDLAKAESTCTTCSVGCGISVESSRNHVLRRTGVDLDPVNWGWLCDKGRFGYEAGESEARLTEPLVRVAGLEPASWGQALGKAADELRLAIDVEGAPRLGVIGGARLTNESAYAWAKLAKGILGTDNVDCQLGDGLPPDVVLGMPRATIDDVCADGGVVVVLAPDLKEELPVLFLRLRDAVVNHGVKVIELSPQSTSVSALAAASLRYRPGEAGLVARALTGDDAAGRPVDGDLDEARALLAGAARVSVVLGRPSVAEAASTIVDAAAALHQAFPTAPVLPALRRGNVHGALDMGLSPGLLPGHVRVDDAGEWFTAAAGAWDVVPDHAGLDTAGILAAAADGAVDTIVLLGADPIADFPDHDLARRALERATVIAVDTHRTASVELASVVLPAAGPDEVDGTTTNIEGRILPLARKVTPPGTARADWHIAAELAHRLGRELGLESVEAIWDEIERLAPSYAGITADVLKVAAGRTGVLMPLDPAQLDELGTSLTLASRRHGIDVGSARAALEAAAAGTDAERMASQMEAKAEQADRVNDTAGGDADAGDAEPDVEADGGPAEPPGPARPGVLAFAPPQHPTELPLVDAYGLRLVATRTLYDKGTLVTASPSLAGLAKPARIRLNPADLSRLGLTGEARVSVSAPRGTVELDAVADPAVPPGSAAMHANHDGADPADLIDVAAAVTTIQVQTTKGGGAKEGAVMLAADPLFVDGVDLGVVVVVLIKTIIAFAIPLVLTAMMIWVERKVHGDMTNRIGPNRAGPWGILQTLADGAKLFTKEGMIPDNADRFVYRLAPYLSAVPAFLVFAIVPFGGDFNDGADGTISILSNQTYLQLADPEPGILIVLALSGIAVYGVMLAGWSSGSKYPLLGSVRETAQMVSYEAALGLSLAAVVLVTGTLSTHSMVVEQAGAGTGPLPNWNIVVTGLVPFVIFFIAATAEMSRPPFDFAEAEQELVAGFNTEYSSIRFALFYIAEFMATITFGAVIATLFLGGPAGPDLGLLPGWLWGSVWFFLKLAIFPFIWISFRATLPRLRYDQLMDLGWKRLIPLSLGWLLVLAAIRISRDEGVGPVVAVTAGTVVAALLLSAAVNVGRRRRELAGPIDGAFD